MPMTRAARGFWAVARIAWPMRLFFMNMTTPAARMQASTKAATFWTPTETAPPYMRSDS